MENKNAFIFSTNYSDPLILKYNPFPKVIEAVLLSEKYSTATAIKRIVALKAHNYLIISDNGNFTRMSKIAKKFLNKGIAIQKDAEMLYLKNISVTNDILLKRTLLINEIESECKKELEKVNFSAIIKKQIACSPDYIIGLEDYTIPVLTIVGLMHPCFKPKPDEILLFQQNTYNMYLEQKNGGFGNKEELSKSKKFLVLHSYDYASANQGATLFVNDNVEGVAISFGGPMASREYIRSIQIKGEVVKFDELLPEPYIIATSILLGMIDGCSNKTLPVHILGIGSPILIVLLGYILRNNSLISIDATSSFKDADDGNIYSNKTACLKLDMYKVMAYALTNNQPYTSKSPFFKDFEQRYPSDWSTLKVKLGIKQDSAVNDIVSSLKVNAILIEKYVPYFLPMRKGNDDLVQAVRIARAGSNYWYLQQICQDIRSRKNNPDELKKWVFNELKRYKNNASKKWAKSIDAIIKILN